MSFSAFAKTTLAAALIAGAATAQAAVLSATNSTFGSFDANWGTRTFTLGSGSVSDVNIAITFAKCDDPSIGANGTSCIGSGYSYNSEIVFRLTNALGTSVNLVNAGTYSGSSPGTGRQTVTFDDQAASLVGGPLVVSGTFRPVGSLAAFNGAEAAGTWTLLIQDTTGADRLDYFTSTLTVLTANVNEASTLGLLGLGLAGFGLRLNRRRA